ncbi:hypothetical protein BU24DRAFT_57443 [Aaosphaeria arxii CBS 175.79]|uniref:Uncharacterized protein n=1 Tax=Aaosphaeria arxii CBS 175.79 TaxID=1450172 RepID=A0A6A5XBV5_9PLEO|nr:uncharacterized protein BU24DRAFT_57443 [Aaosphaeria arxii CBS 175.79]KAF2010383.1 hypothetical protein BU24DRAFT_57443 [Aaosphaeria arxii CBS 175.79]
MDSQLTSFDPHGLLDIPPPIPHYSIPLDRIEIFTHEGPPILAYRRPLEHHFPGLRHDINTHRWLGTMDLSRRLYPYLGRWNISQRSISQALRSLFNHFKRSDCTDYFHDSIYKSLSALLHEDMVAPAYADRSIQRCRRQFIALAFFAQLTQSSYLASALGRFISRRYRELFDHERTMYIDQWATALMAIQDLHYMPDISRYMDLFMKRGYNNVIPSFAGPRIYDSPPWDLGEPMRHHVPFGFDRGRSRGSMIGYGLPPRALTLSPRMGMRYRSPMSVMGPSYMSPPYSMSGQSTGMLVRHLVEQQDIMAENIEDIREDVEALPFLR